MTLRPRALLLSAAVLALGLTACGSSSSSSTTSATSTPATSTPTTSSTTPAKSAKATGSGSSVSLRADPSGQLAYVQKSLKAKAGKVTISFANMSSVPHDVAVGKGASLVGVSPVVMAGSTTLAVTLAKGTYSFYCTVDGHRLAGMQGTLTVS